MERAAAEQCEYFGVPGLAEQRGRDHTRVDYERRPIQVRNPWLRDVQSMGRLGHVSAAVAQLADVADGAFGSPRKQLAG